MPTWDVLTMDIGRYGWWYVLTHGDVLTNNTRTFWQKQTGTFWQVGRFKWPCLHGTFWPWTWDVMVGGTFWPWTWDVLTHGDVLTNNTGTFWQKQTGIFWQVGRFDQLPRQTSCHGILLVEHVKRTASCDTSLVVSGGVLREKTTNTFNRLWQEASTLHQRLLNSAFICTRW